MSNTFSICLSDCGIGAFTTTTCNHIFHKECIDKWLLIKSNCPYCRKRIVSNNRLVAKVDFYNEMTINLSDSKSILNISRLEYNQRDFSVVVNDNIEQPTLDAYRVTGCNTNVSYFDKHSRGYRVVESVLSNQYAASYWINIDESSQTNKFTIIKEFASRPGLYFISDVFDQMWTHEVQVEIQ